MKRKEEPAAIWQAERCDGGAFEYIGAGTVSDVAPAATSQRNSCEMSYRYKREQNSSTRIHFPRGKGPPGAIADHFVSKTLRRFDTPGGKKEWSI